MADAHLPESTKLMMSESGRAPLEPWQIGFCQWLAAHPRSRTKEQERVASELAGTLVPWVEIRRMRAQKNFMAHYGRMRRKIEQRMDDAREAFETDNVPAAIEAHKKALAMAVEEKDYRAIPALVEPAIKALYKQVGDDIQKPLVVLNLGTFAQLNAAEPAAEVEWEEVEDHDSTPT